MRSQLKFLATICAAIFLAPVQPCGNYHGSGKGRRRSPFSGRIVQAQNTKTKITVNVLSDSQGHYRIDRLPPGEYRVTIRGVSFSANPQTGVNLTADQNCSFDFALAKGVAR